MTYTPEIHVCVVVIVGLVCALVIQGSYLKGWKRKFIKETCDHFETWNKAENEKDRMREYINRLVEEVSKPIRRLVPYCTPDISCKVEKDHLTYGLSLATVCLSTKRTYFQIDTELLERCAGFPEILSDMIKDHIVGYSDVAAEQITKEVLDCLRSK